MTRNTSAMTGVATGIVQGAPKPGREHKRLGVFIGKWMTEGETIASAGSPAVKITASDIYEWAPGGFFVVHSAYGRIGDMDVGGVEIISYDPATGQYRSQFYDSQGNMNISELTLSDGNWTWQGERTRCTSELSDDGRAFAAHHQRSDDGVNWTPSMEVTLRKVE